MNPFLEIIIPARNPGGELVRTAASLAAQTNREFSVILSDDFSTTGRNHFDAAEKLLALSRIAVRHVKPPGELNRVEHWNWAHAQAGADWLKLLLPGDELKPASVEKLQERIRERPTARLIRCDAEVHAEWGREILRAPFEQAALNPAAFAQCLPGDLTWLASPAAFACHRIAWQAMGGYATQLPAGTATNLHVLLALHYGLENLSETLAATPAESAQSAGARSVRWFNRFSESWLILRQAHNYCLSAKVPFKPGWLWPRAVLATLNRW